MKYAINNIDAELARIHRSLERQVEEARDEYLSDMDVGEWEDEDE